MTETHGEHAASEKCCPDTCPFIDQCAARWSCVPEPDKTLHLVALAVLGAAMITWGVLHG